MNADRFMDQIGAAEDAFNARQAVKAELDKAGTSPYEAIIDLRAQLAQAAERVALADKQADDASARYRDLKEKSAQWLGRSDALRAQAVAEGAILKEAVRAADAWLFSALMSGVLNRANGYAPVRVQLAEALNAAPLAAEHLEYVARLEAAARVVVDASKAQLLDAIWGLHRALAPPQARANREVTKP